MVYFFIIAAVALRLVPHVPNFIPIAALALFGGVYLNNKYALILPLIAMFIADYFIGFYNPILMISVYGSFIVIGLIGLWLKKNKNIQNIIGATLCGSVLFFLITNLVMWAIQPYMPAAIYPQTLQGLVECYTMGLPFFRNTLMGDMFYVSIMFGLMETVLFFNRQYQIKKGVI